MKRTLPISILVVLLSVAVFSQRIDKPTLTEKPCTDSQKQTIQQGITLHDAKRYADAVEKYQQVLTENPDCVEGMYELSMTYYTLGETTKAMEIAYKGAKYKSDTLPLFYLTIGNIIDDIGKPDEAVKIYRDGIKMLEGDPTMSQHLSSMYYNLGVTLIKQKNHPDAREALKKAVGYNFKYASPHYLLALLYLNDQYKIPAFLAAARLIALEPTTDRGRRAADVVRTVLKPAAADPKTGNINIFVNMNAPKDEGDFAMYDLILGTMLTVKSDKDKNKSDTETFAESVDSLVAMLTEDKKLPSTFVGKNYLPFISDMKKKGHVRTFAYIVLEAAGDPQALKWLTDNEAKFTDFVKWARDY